MSQATVLAQVAALAVQQSDATAVAQYYPELVADLAERGWLSQITALAIVKGQNVQTLPHTMIELYAVIFGDEQIDEMMLGELDEYDSYWRQKHGRPFAWTREEQTAKTLAWYPTPDFNSPPVAGGDPTGADYDIDQAAILHTETRADVLPYLELPLALMILEQEYSRESDHQDMNYAAACQALAALMLKVVGEAKL